MLPKCNNPLKNLDPKWLETGVGEILEICPLGPIFCLKHVFIYTYTFWGKHSTHDSTYICMRFLEKAINTLPLFLGDTLNRVLLAVSVVGSDSSSVTMLFFMLCLSKT